MIIPTAPDPVRASPAARITIWVWAAYAIWQGTWIVWGGIGRWTSPSFAVLKAAPNPTVTWGTILVVLGAGLFIASAFRWFWVKAACCLGIAVWSLCFASGALTAAHANPQMSSTGGPTYVAIAAAILVLVFIDERERTDLFAKERHEHPNL